MGKKKFLNVFMLGKSNASKFGSARDHENEVFICLDFYYTKTILFRVQYEQ